MAWTITNVMIQIIAGIMAANALASIVAVKEFRFGGAISHSIVGAAAGAFSGCFLQTLAMTMVTATGSLEEPTFVQQVTAQVFSGAAAGAVAVLIVGFVKHEIDQHKSEQK